MSETGYSMKKKEGWDLFLSIKNWLDGEKWAFHTKMELNLNAGLLKQATCYLAVSQHNTTAYAVMSVEK